MLRYRLGAALVAIGLTLWFLYGLISVKEMVKENLIQTHCNQGLLLLESTGYFDPVRIANCPPDIQRVLQGRK